MIDPFAKPPPRPMAFESGDTVILCEGRDECAVIRKLTEGWVRPPKIGICQDGANPLEEIKGLALQVRTHRVATIALVFDAEEDSTARKRQLRNWLGEAGLAAPHAPLTIARKEVDGNTVRTSFLINPRGKKSGSIESYFMSQVQASRRWPCVDRLLECYQREQPSRVLRQKLILRTFIAQQNGRNTGLNAAFNSGILSCDHADLKPVRQLLERLRAVSPLEPAAARTKDV